MLNESGMSGERDALNHSQMSAVMNQEQDSKKIRQMYQEFCEVVRRIKQGDEVNLHDLLFEMRFLGYDEGERHVTPDGVPTYAYTSEMLQNFKSKFEVTVRKKNSSQSPDDVIKNLFKICCGIMNMRIKQRGINQMDDRILKSFLDAINFDIQDNDLLI